MLGEAIPVRAWLVQKENCKPDFLALFVVNRSVGSTLDSDPKNKEAIGGTDKISKSNSKQPSSRLNNPN